jgi:hypothetical protein
VHDAQDAITTDATPTVVEPAPADGPSLAEELNALLIRAAVAYRNAERAVEDETAAKADVVKVLGRNSTKTATNPLNPDEEFVQVNVSKVTYSAKVVDLGATEGWVREKYADRIEKKTRLLANVTEDDLFKVLRHHAPYLLEEIDVVPSHVIRELVLKSEKAHQPMGWGGEVGDDAPPGIKVEKSTPRVSITFRNADVVDDLILNGVVGMDGKMLGGAL